MASEYLFAVGTIGLSKLKPKPCTLLWAARHNRREIRAEAGANDRIDPGRRGLNETLVGPGTSEEIVSHAESLMANAGVDKSKLRRDYTQAIELLFSLPPASLIDEGQYFRRCTEWAAETFEAQNILSSDIHRDEPTLHCHVLVLPLVAGKLLGSSLVSPKATAKLSTAFFQEVASKFGLRRPAARLRGDALGRASRAVLEALDDQQDPILRSALWTTVRRDVERDPQRYAGALGLDFQAHANKRHRTMAQIFTSKGKGGPVDRQDAIAIRSAAATPIGFETQAHNPIGIEASQVPDAQEQQTLSCVGFAGQCDVGTAVNDAAVVDDCAGKVVSSVASPGRRPILTLRKARAGQQDGRELSQLHGRGFG